MNTFFNNPWNIVILAVLILALILVSVKLIKDRHKGKKGCAGCMGGSCENCPSGRNISKC